ncbi:MAG: protease pro-enzyme activation domain-containing protein, partial [Terracidiphilus sp.]
MISLPGFISSSFFNVESTLIPNHLRKRKAFSAGYALLTVLILMVLNIGQAQQSVQVLHKHVRSAVSDGQAAVVGLLPPEKQLNLSIVLPLRNQAELTSLLGRLYDPSSPDYRHFLSVDQFTEQFGPTVEDYEAVVSFAEANGFVVTDRPANRLVVPISGSVAEINNAFNLRMSVYQHPTEDRTFFSPDREPSLNLNVPVAHIVGLNNFSLPQSMLRVLQGGAAPADITGSGPGGSYLGSDMRAAYYGGTTLTGNGQAVGLLEFGGYNLSDVTATFTNANQSYSVPVNNVLLDGATGGPFGDDAEQVLDIVQAIGMAPGLSQVRVYIGQGLDDANIFNKMAAENICKQLSVSWGWYPDDPSTDDIFFQEFAAQGQSVLIASGDEGAFDVAVSPYLYPSEDAYVTSVGGTHLTTNGAGGDWVAETVWNSEAHGSGGGISLDGIPIASWQAGVATTANGGSTTLRNQPDVAMEGDYDNYYCRLGSCAPGAAGTSFAAPRWAAFIALVNQQAVEAGNAPSGGIGFINPAIYTIGAGSSYDSDFHDITSGNNLTANQPVWFSATPGYDLTTGWGSANGQNLIDALAGPQVPGFWIASSSGTLKVTQGASGTSTISVTDAGGFTGSVTLAVTSALPSGVTASWGTNPTTGTSVLTVTATSSATPGTTQVTITGTSGSLTETTSFTLEVHGPSFSLSAAPAGLSIGLGASGTSTITVNSLYGFTGNVSLAVTSGLPSGVTASWGTNPTSGTSVLTLTASSTAAGGTANLTITGTSGALTATTNLAVTITAPSFTLFASPSSLGIGLGSSSTSYIYVNSLNGFTGSVNLAVTSALPSGVTATWGTNPTSGTSLLTLTASSSATIGQYSLTITGTSGNLTATTNLSVGVFAPTFTLSASSLNIGQGSSGPSYVYLNPLYGFTGSVGLSVSGLPTGVTASFAPNPTTGSSTLTLTASSSATTGQRTVTVTGTSGSLTVTTTFTLGVYAPSFTISAYSVSIGQGNTSTSYVYVNPQYGFVGSASLSVTGLPTGVTASFAPNPTTGSSTLTLTASSSATVGQSTVTVTGTSGSLTATTTFSLGVYAPTFTLSAPSLSVGQGTSSTSNVYVSPQYGFAGSVSLSVSGLPTGVTASFTPNPTTGTSTLTLTASSSATIGQSTLTLTGTSGSLTKSTTVSLGVYAPTFTLSAGSVNLGQGSSASSYIFVYPQYGFTGSVSLAVTSGLPSGVTASFTPNPATGNSMLTLTATSSAVVGQYSLIVTGTSGNQTATTTLPLGIYAPGFTLGASGVSIGQGTSGTSYVYVYPQYGFTGNVNLSVSGLPSGVTASFAPNPTNWSSTLTFTASSSVPVGQYTVTVTGTSGSLTATTTVALGIYVPTFTVGAPNLNVGQGSSATSYVYVSPQYGFSGNVNLAISGLPAGVTASFAPNPTTGTSTMTLTASSSAAVGQYNVTVTGTSGSVTATAPVTLVVSAPGFTLSAYGLNIGQGSSGTTYVSVYPQYGFAGSVTLAASGLPSGVTASFTPNPATGTSTLTLTATSSAAVGQYNVTVTGTSGSLKATATFVLGVSAPSFTLSANGVDVGQGTSSTSYVYM